MTVSLRPTTPEPFSVHTVSHPILYDIASELHVTPSSSTIIIDLSNESFESKSHDLKLAVRVAQVIGPIIAFLGVITCLYAFVEKKSGYTVLGLAVSFLGCIISCGATCYYINLKERGRI